MNILCLDIGNTSISLCDSKKFKLGKLIRVPSSENFTKVFSNYTLDTIDQVLLCSVVPKITSTVIDFFKSKQIDIFEINYKLNYVKLLVDNPSEVGSAILLNEDLFWFKVFEAISILRPICSPFLLIAR